MITHQLKQSSPEWHQHRAKFRNASDAPAMMGESPYMTRAELLRRVKTGIVPDVDAQTQRRFDDGHRFEALARPLACAIIGEDLYPVVGSNGLLSASFDGLTMDETIGFEHKTLNEALRQCFNEIHAQKKMCFNSYCGVYELGHMLPLVYRIQMQQQIMVSGAARILFVASKWEGEKVTEHEETWYVNDNELAEKIRQGWIQFERDLVELPNSAPLGFTEMPKPRATTDLPALFIRAKGEITADNMQDYGLKLSEKLQAIRSIALVTDQDFSDAKLAAKQLRENIESAKQAKAAMLAETVTVGEAARMIDAWCEDMRLTALQLEKDVEREDKAKKSAMVSATREKYTGHIAELESEISPIRLPLAVPVFADALKNKRNFASMQDALDTMLAGAKIAADAAARAIRINLDCINADGVGYEFLFSDKAQIVFKAPDDLKMLVVSRIDGHKKAKAAEEEATRKRIRAEIEQQERERVEHNARVQAQAAAAQKLIDDAAALAAKQAADAAALVSYQPQPLAAQDVADGVVDAEIKPAARHHAVVQKTEPQTVSTPPSLRLSKINMRLQYVTVTVSDLRALGFPDSGIVNQDRIYHESDFPKICEALENHLSALRAGFSA